MQDRPLLREKFAQIYKNEAKIYRCPSSAVGQKSAKVQRKQVFLLIGTKSEHWVKTDTDQMGLRKKSLLAKIVLDEDGGGYDEDYLAELRRDSIREVSETNGAIRMEQRFK